MRNQKITKIQCVEGGVRQLITCRGVHAFYLLCFLWSTYCQDSGHKVIHFKYVPLDAHLQLCFHRENGSDYLSLFFYISQDNIWESYNHEFYCT